jgi:hypothetical protein
VREKLADRDLTLFPAAEGGEVIHDTLFQIDLLLVEENHDRGRRTHDLGERSYIVYRLLSVDCRTGGDPGKSPEALFHDRCPFPAYDDGCARVPASLNAAGDYTLNCLEAGRGHANVRGWLDG